jgi:hypothetical protein
MPHPIFSLNVISLSQRCSRRRRGRKIKYSNGVIGVNTGLARLFSSVLRLCVLCGRSHALPNSGHSPVQRVDDMTGSLLGPAA